MWRGAAAALLTVTVLTVPLSTAANATHAYGDVPAWVDPAVSWADANDYLTGHPDDTFRPGEPMTRAQTARYVYRTEGSPSVSGLPAHGFSDVPNWVEDAVRWLTAEGLVAGYPDDTFRPDLPMTRSQTVRLVHRLAGEPAGAMAHGFGDVPAWVDEAVTWATDDPPGSPAPLISGYPDDTFRPGLALTRAQSARLLFRFKHLGAPGLNVTVVATGLTIPWGLASLPDGRLLFNERAGGISIRETDGTVHAVAADLSDLYASGETGLMGIVIDPGFTTNRRFYQCQGVTGTPNAVQVVTWELAVDGLSAVRVADPLVGGLPTFTNGRHGGCRLRFDGSGQLWIGTGDGAAGPNPQDLTSLGGKVLRVDPATGAGSVGNPFSASPNADTRRIYSYGHRNVQGLALQPGTAQMWSVEHGSFRDDEVNRLVSQGNAGWDPVPGYNELVPMTDLFKFPSALEAAWSSGQPTIATSGADFLAGSAWQDWEGALAVATLKNRSLRIMTFDAGGAFVTQSVPAELDGDFGRLRTPTMASDGSLYITTANGIGQDRILRVTPSP